jgi:hypothetical protein
VQGRNALDNVGAEGRVSEACGSARCFDECGSDRIHSDVIFAPFHGETFSEVRYFFAFISGAQAGYDQLRTCVNALQVKVKIGQRQFGLVPLVIKDTVGAQDLRLWGPSV